uniref:Uncharacterized protein n=1 Tax=Opuntia streptacantha TaxID=393608 RepID=A0A7C9CPN4_OPUST
MPSITWEGLHGMQNWEEETLSLLTEQQPTSSSLDLCPISALLQPVLLLLVSHSRIWWLFLERTQLDLQGAQHIDLESTMTRTSTPPMPNSYRANALKEETTAFYGAWMSKPHLILTIYTTKICFCKRVCCIQIKSSSVAGELITLSEDILEICPNFTRNL